MTQPVPSRSARRLPTLLFSAVCVGLIVASAAVAAPTALPLVALASSGHWVADSDTGTVAHLDGGTGRIDARVELPGEVPAGTLTVQGATSGFIVARDKVAVFGLSTLTVDSSFPLDGSAAEVPLPIETTGGPYLVYRQAGTVVRLGTGPTSMPAGGPLSRPAWTDGGDVWVHRPDTGEICAVGSSALECADGVQPGEPGNLTVVGGQVAYVSARRDAVQPVEAGSAPVALGIDLPDDALVADRDTKGRLAVVLPSTGTLLLIDDSGVAAGRMGAATQVTLGPGRFTAPVASDGLVAVIDEATHRLLVFDVGGTLLSTTALPPGTTSITRGADGRIYVDDADGAATRVVGSDGKVTSARTSGDPQDSVVVAAPPELRAPSLPVDLPTKPRPGGPGGTSPNPDDGDSSAPTEPQPPEPIEPEPPKGVRAKAGTDGSVTVSWNVVTGATGYRVQSDSGVTQSVTAATASFPSLPIGTPVTFTVVATTATGDTDPSDPSDPVTPRTAPGAPGQVTAEYDLSCGDPVCFPARTVVQWTAPTDLGGGRIDHYEISVFQKGIKVDEAEAIGTVAQLVGPDKQSPCPATEFRVVAVTVDGSTGEGPAKSKASVDTPARPHCSGGFGITNARVTGPGQISGQFIIEAWYTPVKCTVRVYSEQYGIEPKVTAPCGGARGKGQLTDFVITGLQSGVTYTLSGTGGGEFGSDNGNSDGPPLTMP